MSSLRDAMLKAGLIDAKKKKQIERNQRKKAHEQKKLKARAVEEQVPSQEELKQDRITTWQTERDAKIRRHVAEGLVEDVSSGRRRFYFVTRQGHIPYLSVSDVLGLKLETGRAAIVDDPADPENHCIVTRDAALKILELDKEMIRFFKG